MPSAVERLMNGQRRQNYFSFTFDCDFRTSLARRNCPCAAAKDND
jgi:hypothetical protein